jgi:hypothetical protein
MLSTQGSLGCLSFCQDIGKNSFIGFIALAEADRAATSDGKNPLSD